MLKIGGLVAGGLCAAFFAVPACQAQTFQTLHTFKGENIDGAAPLGGLVLAGQTLYGTTFQGGKDLSGLIFQIDLHGNYKIIHQFRGRPIDGAGPYAGMIVAGQTLYGTTSAGGSQDYGTIFSYNLITNKETVLYDFGAPAIGVYPAGELLHVGNLLYGTTISGGIDGCSNLAGCGTLFSFDPTTPSQPPVVLHSFTGGGVNQAPDGGTPRGNLVLFQNALYGVTSFGGTNGCYGGTGCGTIFRYSLDASVPASRRYTFFPFTPPAKPNDGAQPKFGLTVANGMLYGTTFEGGNPTACAPSGCGSVFSFNPHSGSSAETPLFTEFGGNAGAFPSSGLTAFGVGNNTTQPHGFAVGTTLYGGALPCPPPQSNCPVPEGTVYQLDLATLAITPLYTFTGGDDGANPRGTLVRVGNAFYGVTFQGGAFDSGTVFVVRLPKS